VAVYPNPKASDGITLTGEEVARLRGETTTTAPGQANDTLVDWYIKYMHDELQRTGHANRERVHFFSSCAPAPPTPRRGPPRPRATLAALARQDVLN
jgi:hypothetical protein